MKTLLNKILVWWRSEGLKKKEINYPYFLILLIFLSLLSLAHFLSRDAPLLGIPLFFLFYSIGQAILEVFLFILSAYILKRWAPKWAFILFIVISFGFFFIHFTDFTLVRLMDASITYLFRFFIGASDGKIMTAFDALNMNLQMIVMIGAALFLLPLLGLLFYWLTHLISRLKPISFDLRQIAIGVASIALSLFLLDLFAHPFLTLQNYRKYEKALPFGTTFLPPMRHSIQLPAPLASPLSEKKALKKLPTRQPGSKPNIYLFVIETLRSDFLNEKTAPALSCFAKENISFASSFSNANSTYLSWFAIFQSRFPYHWSRERETKSKGSLPLRALRKLGYKIHVFSAASLGYFNMDHLIFGQGRELADEIREFAPEKSLPSWERDSLAIKEGISRLSESEGNLFIFFLDSTHSEYSFPENSAPFIPYAKQIDYLTLKPTPQELESIQNRYRNAIHYIDSLFDRFLDALKEKKLLDASIIAVTGDHGEEFFEEGALFHGTHLNRYQTNVPIYFKFPSPDWTIQREQATHIDVFPTILHYLTKKVPPKRLFDGNSLFTSRSWPYRIAVLQNGPTNPCEIALIGQNGRILMQFRDPKQIYTETNLEILDIDGVDLDLLSKESLQNLFESHFPGAVAPLIRKAH